MRKPVVSAIIFFVLIDAALGGFGIYMVKYPPSHNLWVGVYGFFVFFLGFLPMIIEGGVLIGLAKIPNSYIEEQCQADEMDSGNKAKDKLLSEII
jgi:hypothetical protein